MHLPANTANARHESRGEDFSSSRGTVLTASATINVKGVWSALGAATGFTYEGFTVYLHRPQPAADYMIDIGIDDGAGNNSILLPDLHFAAFKQADEQNLQMFVPVHVPAGALVVARVASSTASAICACLIVGHSANPGGFPGFSRVVALFTPALSRGINVDPGGTANTKGAWAELTASSSVDVAALFGVVGYNGDIARAATASMLLDIGLGAGGSEFVLVPDISFGWGTTWDGPNDVFFQPIAAQIAIATRVAARAQCDVTTDSDRDIDLAVYGLVR